MTDPSDTVTRSIASWRTRWLAAWSTLALATLAVAAGAGSAPAHAAPDRCDGVWIVVDAGTLGGPTTTRCATTDRPIDGREVLTRAGHHVSDVPGQPGFICRIDRRPDPCPGTPPADAYWSYWTAEPGGSWTYSHRGATFRTAEPGSVDAWTFGAGDPPSVPPPAPAPQPSADPAPEPPRDGGDGSNGGANGDADGDAASERREPRPSPSDTERGGTPDGSDSERPTSRPDDAGATSGGADTTRDTDEDAAARPSTGDDEAEGADGARDDEGASSGRDDVRPGVDDTDDDDVPTVSPEPIDGEVVVAVEGTDGAGSTASLLAGGGLTTALLGTAVWTARRRRLDDPDLDT